MSCLVMLTLSQVVAARPREPAPSDLAWVAPSQARVTRLFQARRPGVSESVDASQPLMLRAGDYLLIPARGGVRVRISAVRAEVGFGTGYDELPDVVTWQKVAGGAPLQLRVPSHSSARFVVVRALTEKPSPIRVWLAAPLEDPLAWYRADDLVADFIEGSDDAPPALPRATRAGEPILRWIAAARRVLSKPALSAEAKRFLEARWLSLSMQHRPLFRPFFHAEALKLSGGREWPEAASPDPDAAEVRNLAVGDRLTITGGAADVVSMLVRSRARGVTRYGVYAGDELVLRVEANVPERGAREGFLGARLHRIVPPASGAVSVVVDEGQLLLSARGYSLNTSVFDFSNRRRPRALLRSAALPQGQSASIAGLSLQADRLRSKAGREGLEQAVGRVAGADAGLHTLLLYESLRHDLGATTVVEQLSSLWQASRLLPDQVRLPLRREALAALFEVSTGVFDRPVALPEARAPDARPPKNDVERERALVAALRATLVPERDGGGPRQALRTERWAASAADLEVSALADKVWSREAIYKPIESETAETTERLTQVATLGACAARGPSGLRWLLAEPEQPLLVKAVGGSHSRLQIQGQPGATLQDALVAIDDERFAVHAGARLGSTLAVKPGSYRFRQESGGPLLLRFETDAEFACDRLFEQERWVIVDETARFALPAGLGQTLLSLLVAEESLGVPAEIEVAMAGVRQRASFEGKASGQAEFEVPAQARFVELSSQRRLLVLVRIKQRRSGFGKKAKPQPVVEPPPVSEAVWLEQLRTATRRLRRAETAVARDEYRQARIEALQGLGYARLAASDQARLDEPPPALPVDPLPFMALKLPPGAKRIEAIGALPLIPPLPQPEPAAWFEELLNARLKGLRWAAVLETLARRSRHSSAADALLLARLAEQAEKLDVAQAAWLRLAQAHRSGVLLKEAARVTTDIAAHSLDLDRTLSAYILTLKAARQQADVEGLLGRLNASLAWPDVEAEQLSQNVWLEHRRHVADDEPLALRVRRALTDAPDNSVLLTHAPAVFFTSRFEGPLVQVDALCHSVSGPLENCPLKVRVDGEQVACLPVGAERKRAFEQRRLSPEVARPLGCRVELPEGAQRLSVALAPDSGTALGWALARSVTPSGLGPSSYMARWMRADAAQQVSTWLVGPSVLRIEARAASDAARELKVRLVPVGGGDIIEQTHELARGVDQYTTAANGVETIRDATRFEVLIEEPRQYQLSLAPSAGSALVRLSLSHVVAPPRAVTAQDEDVADLDEPGFQLIEPWPEAGVGFDPIVGPLTLGASLALRSEDLVEGDRDPRTRYLELGVQARRALILDLLWGAAGLLRRERAGPESHGAELGLWLTSNTPWPGAFTRLEAVTQRLGGKQALGYYAVGGVYYPFELGEKLRLVPTAQVVVRNVAGEGRGRDDTDRVVYSPYAASRPHSVDLLSRLDYRAFVDFAARVEARARAAPYFKGWDRFDLSVGGDLMAGRGWSPWLRGELLASHRPVSPQRQQAFTRFAASPSVVFWRWLDSAQRLTLAFQGSYFVDVPKAAGRDSAFSGQLALSYEYSFQRGLEDLNLGQRPFRARMEEERPGLRRGRVGTHPYWSEAP